MSGAIKSQEATADQVLLTVEQAAKRLALGRTTLYALIRQGDLRSVHVGRSVRIRAADLAAFAEDLVDVG